MRHVPIYISEIMKKLPHILALKEKLQLVEVQKHEYQVNTILDIIQNCRSHVMADVIKFHLPLPLLHHGHSKI
jgi:hypothetical protein